MLQPGDVILFRAETQPYDENYHEFFLKFLSNDENGMMMYGILPPLWRDKDRQYTGPSIKDEHFQYNITKIDYKQNLVWLMKLRKLWRYDSRILNLNYPVRYRIPHQAFPPQALKKSRSF